MTSTAQQAVLLDELIRHPLYPQLAAWMNGQAPPAYRDQAQAAYGHARQIMNTFATVTGGTPDERTAAQVPEWIRLSTLQAWIQIDKGVANTCRHNPTFDRPEPIVVAAWRPGKAVCARCVPLIQPAPGSDEDRTCDQCGHVCVPMFGDLIHPCVIQLGSLLFQYGLCRSCCADMKALRPAA